MKKYLLATVAALSVITFTAQTAQAGEHGGYRDRDYGRQWHVLPSSIVPPHHLVAHEDYIKYLTPDQILELNEYLDYVQREPCQNYREPPTNFYRDGCTLKYRYPERVAEAKPVVVEAPPPAVVEQHREVLMTYEINFDFDKSTIGPVANSVLDKVASEITTYRPGEVTVAGHADRAGAEGYNDALSQRRAQAVSSALTARGVENRVIDQKAYGENAPAVETKDGVALRENRRVVIEFRK